MILKQMNAKMKLDLYRLSLPSLRRSMVIGIDTIPKGNNVTIGLTASYNQYQSQYYGVVRKQKLPARNEFPNREALDTNITTNRTNIISQFICEALEFY